MGKATKRRRKSASPNPKLEEFFYTFESQILPRSVRKAPARIALHRSDAGFAFRISVEGWALTSTPWIKEREGG